MERLFLHFFVFTLFSSSVFLPNAMNFIAVLFIFSRFVVTVGRFFLGLKMGKVIGGF